MIEGSNKDNAHTGRGRQAETAAAAEVKSQNYGVDFHALSTTGAVDFRLLLQAKWSRYMPGTRIWLFKRVQKWFESAPTDKSKVFWLLGSAGMGKTVISAKLIQDRKQDVVGFHFCRFDNLEENEPATILRSLSAMLRVRLPGFLDQLDPVDTKDVSTDPEKLFETLLRAPLSRLDAPASPKLIIIDALDELPKGEVLSGVISIIKDYFSRLPSWLRILLTSRPEREIKNALETKFEPVELLVDETNNQEDVRAFLRKLAQDYTETNFSVAMLEKEVEYEFELRPGSMTDQLLPLQQPLLDSKRVYDDAMKDIMDEPHFEQRVNQILPRRNPELRQDSGDLDFLYQQAEETQTTVGRWQAEKFSRSGKLIEGNPKLKRRERALEKIQNDYNGESRRIRDLSRFTLQFEKFEHLFEAFETMNDEKSFIEIVQVKNKYLDPSPLGHRDVNVNLQVKLSDGSYHLCEVQMNLTNILEAKKHCHGKYEQIRSTLPILCREAAGEVDVDKLVAHILHRLHNPSIDTVVDKLAAKAEGLFQHAALLEEELKRRKEDDPDQRIDFDTLSALPSGLHELYTTNFERSFPNGEGWAECKRLIAHICAAQEPIPTSLLEHIMGKDLFLELSSRISLVFPVGSDKRIHAMHKSVKDWIEGKTSDGTNSVVRHSFFISTGEIDEAHAILGRACLNLVTPSGDGSVEDHDDEVIIRYALKHVVVHVCKGGMGDDLERVRNELLLCFGWLSRKVKEVGPYETMKDCTTFVKAKKGRDRPVYLIKHALQLSLPALYKDPRELASQFVGGRLAMRYEEQMFPEVSKVVEEAKRYRPPYGKSNKGGEQPNEGTTPRCWMPTTSCLASAGNPVQSVLEGHRDSVSSVCWSPDGMRILSGSSDKTVRVWDIETGRCNNILDGHFDWVSSVCWSPDGSKFVSGSDDNSVRIWDIETGRCSNVLEGHSGGVNSVSWSPDGMKIVSGSDDKSVRIWEVETGMCTNILVGHADGVSSVAWSPDGTKIVSGGRDKTVRVWDTETGKCRNTLCEHSGIVNSVHWSPDGTKILSGSRDKSVRVWDAETGRCVTVLEGHSSAVSSVCWSFNGTKIVSGSRDKTVRVWDVAGKCINVLEGHNGSVNSVCWSPDGTKIASSNVDRTVRVWDIQMAKRVNMSEGHREWVSCVSWNSDGTKIVSGSADMTVRTWDVETGRCCNVLEGHRSKVLSVCWSPDGTKIASGSSDETVLIWDAEAGSCSHVLEEHSGRVMSVRWSPDGTKIASGSYDETVRIWDVETGRCINVLEGHSDVVLSVSWSHDSQKIRSTEDGGAQRVWDAKTGKCLREGKAATFSKGFPLDNKGEFSSANDVSFSVDGKTNPKAYFYGETDPSRSVQACIRDDRMIHILRAL